MTTLTPPSPKAAMLLAYLQRHVGKQNGVTARQLAQWFNWKERDVRKLITELRDRSELVMGMPGEGYYMAANAEEIDHSVSFLVARAKHTFRMARNMKAAGKAAFTGQRKLEVVS